MKKDADYEKMKADKLMNDVNIYLMVFIWSIISVSKYCT